MLYAHGSGRSRHNTRNKRTADVLHAAGVGTLLLDLLTPEEERAEQITRHLRFDIELLTERLIFATEWLRGVAGTSTPAPVGYFGASTGAAAALSAAALVPEYMRSSRSRC